MVVYTKISIVTMRTNNDKQYNFLPPGTIALLPSELVQQVLMKIKPSQIWCHVNWQLVTDVFEKSDHLHLQGSFLEIQ